ncbi:unnamed protein product [Dicrocoelium dendriticum]|nr:unnamed protein product [Dicrocoelium dendriticum]
MPESLEQICRCILATDMSRHNDILSQFNDVILMDLETAWRTDPETNLPVWSSDKTRRDLVMMIYIKVCDISNECRPLKVAGPWINRLLSEFFHQVRSQDISCETSLACRSRKTKHIPVLIMLLSSMIVSQQLFLLGAF